MSTNEFEFDLDFENADQVAYNAISSDGLNWGYISDLNELTVESRELNPPFLGNVHELAIGPSCEIADPEDW